MGYKCDYCNKLCKNSNSLKQHEIRCKYNPKHIICYGNKHNTPLHYSNWKDKHVIARNGDVLDITNEDLDKYKLRINKCEICGKTIEESVKTITRFTPKNLCIDHDHISLKFRGLLCSVCNRQLGWYEKYKEQISNYLNKDDSALV